MADSRIPLDRQMLISAVRYALGRQTYIVHWTVSEVLRVWPDLDTHTREIIHRDVGAAFCEGRIYDIDRSEWQRITESET